MGEIPARHPAHLAQDGDVSQRAQKPKSHWEKTPAPKQKAPLGGLGGLTGPWPASCGAASSPGRCWWRGFGAAPTPCRGSRVPQDRPEEADEAVSLQQHAQDRPAHEDDEDPPQEEAGALQLLPLEEEGEGPPEADDEDQAGEEEDLGGGKRDG